MRRFLSLFILLASGLPALSLPVLAADPPAACAPPPHAARQTWEGHFTGANLSHDGHLTLEEAKGGYGAIAKHFDDIDVEHKGYVTENDIRAWRVMQKAAHRLGKPPEDKLRPRSAVQITYPGRQTVAVARTQTMATSTVAPGPEK